MTARVAIDRTGTRWAVTFGARTYCVLPNGRVWVHAVPVLGVLSFDLPPGTEPRRVLRRARLHLIANGYLPT